MTRAIGLLVALSCAFSEPVHAQSAPTAEWVPIGKWSVDGSGDPCVLSREFASGSARLTFSYRPWFAFSGVGITLESRELKPKSGPVRVTLLPEGRMFTFAGAPAHPGVTLAPGLTASVQDGAFADAFARAEAMEVATERAATIRVALGPAGSAMRALRTCEDHRLRSYGLDPATVVVVPVDRMLAALTSNDYPADAIRVRAQGKAITVVGFDRAGMPTTCRVAKGTGNPSLDRASCVAALRLRLPRVGGGEVTRWTVFPVRWALPDARP